MSDSEIKTLEGLRVLIIERCNRLDKDIGGVKVRLGKIETKLHVTGNGSPDISTRLDRLEKAQEASKESKKDRTVWKIAMASAAAALLGSLLSPLFTWWLNN